eukprot:TRINITY_DN3069_c0_g1_i1.p1 TRINITY_DN3069_c0_g1~~TRINITY_DN3069_c0_g1_i1.p1  ORF type:complete len:1644 (+),score=487.55 TRINITY_DN3069_c0_g1_i1:893-5824(+)
METASTNSSATASSLGSTTTDGNSPQKIIGKVIEERIWPFFLLARDRNYPKVALIVAFIEYLQILTIAFDYRIFDWGELHRLQLLTRLRSVSVSDSYVADIFTWTLFTSTLLFVLFAIAVTRRRTSENDWKKSFIRIVVEIFPAVFFPFSGILLQEVICDGTYVTSFAGKSCTTSGNLATEVIAALLAVILLLFRWAIAILDAEFIPKNDRLGSLLTTMRPRYNLFAIVTPSLLHYYSYARESTSSIYDYHGETKVFGFVIIVHSFFLWGYLARDLPYHNRWSNQISAAGTALLFSFSVTSVVSSFHSSRWIPLIVCISSAAVLVPLASAVTYLRCKRLYDDPGRRLANLSLVTPVTFGKPFEVEIAARGAVAGFSTESVMDGEILSGLFGVGIEQFPESFEIKFHYAVYLLKFQTSESLQLAGLQLTRAQTIARDALYDTKYMLQRAENVRKRLSFQFDRGTEEINSALKEAEKHEQKCKNQMILFWKSLSSDVSNLDDLPSIVAIMEKYERKSEEIYKQLLERFPKSSRVIRQYGTFLTTIKNDAELATKAFHIADSLEEEQSQKHRKNHGGHSRRRLSFQSEGMKTRISEDYRQRHVQIRTDHDSDRKVKFVQQQHPTMKMIHQDSVVSDISEEAGDIEEGRHGDISSLPGTPCVMQIENQDSDRESHWKEIQEVASADDIEEEGISGIGKNAKREMQMRRRFKQQIDNSKSEALRKLNWVIVITLLVFFVDITAVFVTTHQVYRSYEDSVITLRAAGKLRHVSNSSPFLLRETQISDYYNLTEEANSAKSRAFEELEFMQQYVVALGGYHDSYWEVRKAWSDPDINVTEWIPESNTYQMSQINLYDLMLRFVKFSRAGIEEGYKNEVNFTSNEYTRFVIDNGLTVLSPQLNQLLETYERKCDYNNSIARISSGVLFGISSLIVVILIRVLFIPSLNTIRRERTEALKLFLLIPKSAINEIYVNMTSQKSQIRESNHYGNDLSVDTAESDSSLNGNNATTLPVIKSLFVRFSLAVAVIAIIATAIVTISIAFSFITNSGPSELDDVSHRRTAGMLVAFWASELILGDSSTSPHDPVQTREYLKRSIADLIYLHEVIKFGNSEKRGMLGRDEVQDQLLYNVTCEMTDQGRVCEGIDAMVIEISEAGRKISETPLDELKTLGYENPHWTTLQDLVEPMNGTFDLFAGKSVERLLYTDTHQIQVLRTTITILYASGLVILGLTAILLRPIVTKIKEENSRTMKMLLLLPTDVIESVPAINDFLAAGFQQKSHVDIKDAFQEISEKNKAVSEVSIDPILVLSDLGLIESFSTAAQSLLGYTEEEMLGKSAAVLFPSLHDLSSWDDLKGHFENMTTDVVAKDGSNLPVTCHSKEGMLRTGKKFYVVVMRDLREIRRYGMEVSTERKRADDYLFNTFPKPVAEYLKKSGALEKNELVPLQSYESATILFADIVGFTTMCSKMDPSTVLEIISDLFGRWDSLCSKYNVERIKSIGDCVMVAGGVPTRSENHVNSVLGFAIEMLQSVQDFNKTSGRNLEVRVGLNTGPVLAGLIGRNRTTFDLWGDAVNIASRMESTGVPGRIQVSQTTYDFLKETCRFEERGKVQVKGKGEMSTYLYVSKKIKLAEVFSVADQMTDDVVDMNELKDL